MKNQESRDTATRAKMRGAFSPRHGDLDKVIRIRRGIKQADFKKIAVQSPFTTYEWSHFLSLSERTMQRYEKQKKAFAPSQSEKILEIEQLNEKGMEVFEDKSNFKLWLESKNIALGGMKPKDLFHLRKPPAWQMVM